MRANRQHQDNGFTLIEVLLAMTILTVGLLGMMALTVSIMQQNGYSKAVTTATTLAQDALERAVFTGYDNLPAADQITAETYGSIAGFPDYRRTVAVDVDAPEPGMKEVLVTVAWNNDSRNLTMNAIVTR
ncbi:MAG: prepilin-type N-terminal cleavage/methylation domain-containing protein [Thermodesulfobacteriota bacterium]